MTYEENYRSIRPPNLYTMKIECLSTNSILHYPYIEYCLNVPYLQVPVLFSQFSKLA